MRKYQGKLLESSAGKKLCECMNAFGARRRREWKSSAQEKLNMIKVVNFPSSRDVCGNVSALLSAVCKAPA